MRERGYFGAEWDSFVMAEDYFVTVEGLTDAIQDYFVTIQDNFVMVEGLAETIQVLAEAIQDHFMTAEVLTAAIIGNIVAGLKQTSGEILPALPGGYFSKALPN